jgi:2'-5' RNA ligase
MMPASHGNAFSPEGPIMFSQMSLSGIFPALAPKRRQSVAFAVLPDDDAREQLWRLSHRVRDDHRLAGRPLRINRSHVALLDLGSFAQVPEEIVEAARHAALSLDMPAFDVAFNRVQTFRARRSDPATVLRGSDECLSGLMTLAEKLRGALAETGLEVAPLRTPHVTLIHGDRAVPEELVEPIRWTVGDLVLLKSFTGDSPYIELGRWPLRTPRRH